jgi:SAM-dependent methyltransferase
MSPASETIDPLVPDEISPLDTMLEGDRAHYFSVGQSALRCIQAAMFAARKEGFDSILDFGSGYGRVLRVLRAAFPAAHLAASDIDADALEFCSKQFGATPYLSHADPGHIAIDRQFDLIWCGTLLTNLDQPMIGSLLRLFHACLQPGGMLVFTTHGPFCAERIRTGECTYGLEPGLVPELIARYDHNGFAYLDYPSEVRARLGLVHYGISLCKPSWVCGQLERVADTRIVNYTERAWDNHQDSVACLKLS